MLLFFFLFSFQHYYYFVIPAVRIVVPVIPNHQMAKTFPQASPPSDADVLPSSADYRSLKERFAEDNC
jgi:hypothetical protein